MAGRLGAPNAGRIPSSAFYASTGDIYAPAADAFFKLPYKTDSIQENVFGSDGANVNWNLATEVDDAIGITESYLEFLVTFFAEAEELATFSENFTLDRLLYNVSTEGVAFTDSRSPSVLKFPIVTEFLRVREALLFSPTINISDTFSVSLSEALTTTRVVELTETFNSLDAHSPTTIYRPVQDEVLAVATDLIIGFPVTVLETLTIGDALSVIRSLRVLEQLGFNVSNLANTIRRLTFLDQIRILDTLSRFVAGDVAEAFAFTETPVPKFFLTRTASDAVAIAESLSRTLILRLTAQETVNLDDIDVLKYIFRPTLNDAIRVSAAYVSPGNTFTTWVINTENGFVTEYTNYNFNSFAEVGDTYWAASDTGLYNLVGDDDDGADIVAHLKSGLAQFGGSRFSSFAAAYLGLRGGGDWVLKLVTGDGKEYVYSVVAQDMQTTKVRLGKGLRARYFAFELLSTGQDFDLDTVEFIPLIAKRRV